MPSDFSGAARKNVMDAEITACRNLREAIRSHPQLRPLTASARESGNEQVLRVYVLPVFLAFAKEVCALGQRFHKPWFNDHIDREARIFLRQLVSNVHMEFEKSGYPLYAMTGQLGGFVPGVKDVIEESPDWRAYQDLLLALSHPSDSSADAPTESSASKPVRRFREPNLELLKSKETVNRIEAADGLGLSLRQFDRWVKDEDNRITALGVGARKRFKTKELLRLLSESKTRQK
jgi:hypothetical protein